MKRKLFLLVLLVLIVFTASGCKKDEMSDAVKFKNEYESLNDVDTSYGGKYRAVNISDDNLFVYSNPTEIINMIENNETFYVYFGSSYCPWCRSVISMASNIAAKKKIDKIYYVDIWDGNHVEILRDSYKVDENGELVLVSEGTPEYKKLLAYFDNVLKEYTINTKDGKTISVGEKRIYAPNFIYVENGNTIRLETGMSDLQKGANDELTDEILKDEETRFNNFFKGVQACDIDEGC